MNDTVTILCNNGSKHENIPASVDGESIIIDEVTIPISMGDRIERKLPSGLVESLKVTDVHLQKGLGRSRGRRGIPDFYEIAYEREGVQKHSVQPGTVHVNVKDSPQARVNLNSTDHSTNVINWQPEDVFLEIREILRESLADSEELDLLLERVDDMERSKGTGSFIGAYQEFIAAAAAHMTVIAPAIPALTTMLTSTGG
ncbi:MAG: hypothetical protein OXF76_03865 [Caldilineaceae bacterium]|nr:hypothetical protein [Caldilineaceae bacterium]